MQNSVGRKDVGSTMLTLVGQQHGPQWKHLSRWGKGRIKTVGDRGRCGRGKGRKETHLCPSPVRSDPTPSFSSSVSYRKELSLSSPVPPWKCVLPKSLTADTWLCT